MQQPLHNLAFESASIMAQGQIHQPVLVREVLTFLAPERGGIFVDCTVGAGGHAGAILAASDQARVIGVDRDKTALAVARERLGHYGRRFRAIHGHFKELSRILETLGVTAVDGILADLGVSSLQLEDPRRGFSFQREGPLDMRMDQGQELTAADLVNTLPEAELADILYRYGEERAARRIARAIVKARQKRPIETTTELAEIVRRVVGRRGRIHPATRTFQALRIAVNEELQELETLVTAAIDWLKPGGRLVIISFHSLEDRLVKQAFRRHAGRCLCFPPWPSPAEARCPRCGAEHRVDILTPKPVRPSQAEVATNPRARSARLRACQKRTPTVREND